MCGSNRRTATIPVAAMTVALPTPTHRLRDRKRKPRNRSNAPRLTYSGTKRCADVENPRSDRSPIIDTRVQT